MFFKLIFFFMHLYGYFPLISAAHKHVFVYCSEGQLRDHTKLSLKHFEGENKGKTNPVFCAFTVIAIF